MAALQALELGRQVGAQLFHIDVHDFAPVGFASPSFLASPSLSRARLIATASVNSTTLCELLPCGTVEARTSLRSGRSSQGELPARLRSSSATRSCDCA